MIDVQKYLDRLGLKAETPSLEFLKKLQSSHLHQIPFENLDIHYGSRIVLDIQKIAQKILNSKRGGYCFELNGLYFELLKNLGFKCHLSSACFYLGDGKYSPSMDHVLIVVSLDQGLFVTDVGLIQGYIYPKRVQFSNPQLDYTQYYKWEKDDAGEYLLKKSADGITYDTYYKSSLRKTLFIQFLDQNNKHQDDPESFFVQNKVISRINENKERIKLTDQEFKIIRGSFENSSPINNEEEFLARLEEYFDLYPVDLLP